MINTLTWQTMKNVIINTELFIYELQLNKEKLSFHYTESHLHSLIYREGKPE